MDQFEYFRVWADNEKRDDDYAVNSDEWKHRYQTRTSVCYSQII